MATPAKATSDETFAGSAGNLSDNGRSATRVTFDTLLSNGFEPQQDMEGVSQTGLCRVGDPPRGSRTWPVVVPSVELYGRIAGWRIEDKADAVAAGADGAAAIAEKAEMCEILDRNVYEPYRWQFSPQHEKAAALEHRLAELTYSIAANSGQPLDKMSVGRICLDGAESGRINAASVALELPAEAGRTTRLQLDLREVPSFGVFPGQVVGVQGAAPTNDKIIVSSVFADGSAPRAQVPYTTAAALHSARSGGGPVRVWVASGPFTSNANLEFEHLQALIDQAEEAKPAPDVLILQGPFVDVDHPMAKTGGIEYTGVPVTYKTLWQEVFLGMLNSAIEQKSLSNLEIVLQAAPSDGHADQVYPQWPLPADIFQVTEDVSEALLRRITVLPNPATFVVGDLVFGSTSVDVCFHLNAEDAARNMPGDRYQQLASYVVKQRCYYPLFPASLPPGPSQTSETAFPLEVPQLWHCGMNVTPDVLLLPCKIGRPCTRVINTANGASLAVNPGFATRGNSPGQFAKIYIFPGEHPAGAAAAAASSSSSRSGAGAGAGGDDDGGKTEYVSNNAPARVRVEIAKL